MGRIAFATNRPFAPGHSPTAGLRSPSIMRQTAWQLKGVQPSFSCTWGRMRARFSRVHPFLRPSAETRPGETPLATPEKGVQPSFQCTRGPARARFSRLHPFPRPSAETRPGETLGGLPKKRVQPPFPCTWGRMRARFSRLHPFWGSKSAELRSQVFFEGSDEKADHPTVCGADRTYPSWPARTLA